MATSGTTTFSLDIGEIIEEACERCGIEPRTGYALKSARRSLNLLTLEFANKGINLWTVESVTLNLVAGQATYNLPVDTVAILDAVIRTNAGNASLQADIVITPISFTTYSAQTAKLSQGFPTQFYYARNVTTPTVTFWQVPDSTQPYQFVYYRLRRIQDVGTSIANTEDVPFRFLPALIAGLAYHIALKKAPDRMPMLKELYEETFAQAADEDRERVTFKFVPRIGS